MTVGRYCVYSAPYHRLERAGRHCPYEKDESHHDRIGSPAAASARVAVDGCTQVKLLDFFGQYDDVPTSWSQTRLPWWPPSSPVAGSSTPKAYSCISFQSIHHAAHRDPLSSVTSLFRKTPAFRPRRNLSPSASCSLVRSHPSWLVPSNIRRATDAALLHPGRSTGPPSGGLPPFYTSAIS